MTVYAIGADGDDVLVDVTFPGPWVAAAQHVEDALACSLGRPARTVTGRPAPDRAVHVDPPIFDNARTVVAG